MKSDVDSEARRHPLRLQKPVQPAPADNAPSVDPRCSNCTLRSLCMPVFLSSSESSRLDDIIVRTRDVAPHEMLYRADDPFHALYAIKVGSFKTVITQLDGREQIIGFKLP